MDTERITLLNKALELRASVDENRKVLYALAENPALVLMVSPDEAANMFKAMGDLMTMQTTLIARYVDDLIEFDERWKAFQSEK